MELGAAAGGVGGVVADLGAAASPTPSPSAASAESTYGSSPPPRTSISRLRSARWIRTATRPSSRTVGCGPASASSRRNAKRTRFKQKSTVLQPIPTFTEADEEATALRTDLFPSRSRCTSTRSFFSPARVTAEAGSHPSPRIPASALAIAISASLTSVRHQPPVSCTNTRAALGATMPDCRYVSPLPASAPQLAPHRRAAITRQTPHQSDWRPRPGSPKCAASAT